MFTLQKYRSNTAVDLASLPEDVKAGAWPWVYGDKCPLPQLTMVLDRVDDGADLNPFEYHNFLVILYRFSPEILFAMDFYDSDLEMLEELPSVLDLAKGWEQ